MGKLKEFLQTSSTKTERFDLFFKVISFAVICLVTFITINASHYAKKIKTTYSPKQFQPKTHDLLEQSESVQKKYSLQENSPHLILLSLKESTWLEDENFEELLALSEAVNDIPNIEETISLANVETALIEEDSFFVGRLNDLFQSETESRGWVLEHPLLSPRLISRDGKHTVFVVSPSDMKDHQHLELMERLKTFATVYTPNANVKIGGPAAIRTQVTNILSKEIMIFVSLSLLGALMILLVVFRGWTAVPTTLFIVVCANLIALGVMSLLGSSFTVLSTTLPIIVTITVVAISTHTMVRLAEEKEEWSDRPKSKFIFHVMKELAGPHMLTAITTMVGFGTLAFSEVPLINEYGITIAAAVPCAALMTLFLLPSLLIWAPLPNPRSWLSAKSKFAGFVVNYKKPLFVTVTLAFFALVFVGKELQWTSRMFDDLPNRYEARSSTKSISKHLGGVIPLEISLGKKGDTQFWKDSDNLKKLDATLDKWDRLVGVGSVMGVHDFARVADPNLELPKSNAAWSEILLVYGMSNQNPVKPFLSPSYDYTRINVNFRDIPADKMQRVIKYMKKDLNKSFPELDIETGGLAATIHPLNDSLSKDLMLGFFYAMFWIVLLLTFVFNCPKWALVAVIPNLVPPVALLGTLAITKTPIKPSIAIIFAISLGIAFDNTVYILGRLKQMLKLKKYKELPVKELLSFEASPCFVTSFSLFAGFSIFLFSAFSTNQVFGVFMLLSIVAGLIGDLILLPSTLKMFPNILERKEQSIFTSLQLFLKQEKVVRSIIFMLSALSTFMLVYSQPVTAKSLSANAILKKVEKNSSPPNETANIKMQIVEPDGSKKLRDITIKRKNSNAQKALVRIHEPSDLKGVSLLSIHEDDSDDQWLYLPSTKRSRRIMGSGKTGKFLDSELSYEDMRVSTYAGFKNKIIRQGGKGAKKFAVIESKTKKDSDSSYSKILTWVNLKHNRVQKAEYYDKKGKLIKTMSFHKYKKYGKKYWRAGKIVVKNVQENRSTTLLLKKVNLQTLADNEFTKSALAR